LQPLNQTILALFSTAYLLSFDTKLSKGD